MHESLDTEDAGSAESLDHFDATDVQNAAFVVAGNQNTVISDLETVSQNKSDNFEFFSRICSQRELPGIGSASSMNSNNSLNIDVETGIFGEEITCMGTSCSTNEESLMLDSVLTEEDFYEDDGLNSPSHPVHNKSNNDYRFSEDAVDNSFCSDFKTGNNSSISISNESMNVASKFTEMFGCNNEHHVKRDLSEVHPIPAKKIKSGAVGICTPIFGHSSTGIRAVSKMQSEFSKIVDVHLNIDRFILLSCFKSAWINTVLSNIYNVASPEFIEIVSKTTQLLVESEHLSVLRRIVEGDEGPHKYIGVVVIGFDLGRMEISDGYYSIWCNIDPFIQRKIDTSIIVVGTRLKIFGAVYSESFKPSSVLGTNLTVLVVGINNMKIDHSTIIGYQHATGFLSNCSSHQPGGGLIGCIEISISKTIEVKYLFKVMGYKKLIHEDRMDEEIASAERQYLDANINQFAKLRDVEQNILKRNLLEEFRKKYAISKISKFTISDKNNCVGALVWWGNHDFSAGFKYRCFFISLVNENGILQYRGGRNSQAVQIRNFS